MGIWTLVFNIVTGNIVSPIVYGRTVHLHPALVLVGIPAGSAIAGILGMFMVVPVLGIISATWRTVLDVMGSRATPPQPGPDAADGDPAMRRRCRGRGEPAREPARRCRRPTARAGHRPRVGLSHAAVDSRPPRSSLGCEGRTGRPDRTRRTRCATCS